MSHVRQQIRDAMATAITSLASGATVYTSRVYPFDVSPSLAVYSRQEQSEPDSMTPPRGSMRELLMAIEIRVKGGDIDDVSDTIAAEVEAAIGADIHLGGLAKNCYLVSTEPELDGSSDKPVQKTVLTYLVQYRVLENNAEVAI